MEFVQKYLLCACRDSAPGQVQIYELMELDDWQIWIGSKTITFKKKNTNGNFCFLEEQQDLKEQLLNIFSYGLYIF